MNNESFASDGDEIAIMATPGVGDRYASVFLSKNRRRLGIRLERPGYTVWLDSRIVLQLTQALQEIKSRLA